MTRRRLLLILTGLAAAFGSLWWSRRSGLDDAAAKLTGTPDSRDSAAVVGAAAMPALPPGTRAEHLILDIARALEIDPAALGDLADGDLRTDLEALIRAEYIAGDTLSVQGWELSATEARLYALAFLTR